MNLSTYELKLVKLSYQHYLKTGSRDFSYTPINQNEFIHTQNSIESLEKAGYITLLTNNPTKVQFSIEEPLIQHMESMEI